MKKFLFFLLSMTLCFASCSKDALHENIVEPEIEYFFHLNKYAIEVAAEACEDSIIINTNGQWSASCNASWITISPNSGSPDDKKLMISISDNYTKTQRNCMIELMCKSDGYSTVFDIFQKGRIYNLSTDISNISCQFYSFKEIVAITTNDEWEFQVNESWVSLSSYSGKGNDSITIIIEENTSLSPRNCSIVVKGLNCGTTKEIKINQEGKKNIQGYEKGHEWVDLGLKSGTLWATCNIGAKNPENFGNYYAWGEIETKTNFHWGNYKFENGGVLDGILTKYMNNKVESLEAVDDAASANWGGKWRMPSLDEAGELYRECIWTWSIINGINGYIVSSKKNNNSIFLPAAGQVLAGDAYYGDIGERYYIGERGYYWTTAFYGLMADAFMFEANNSFWFHNGYRCDGNSVRPVMSSK